MNLFTAAARFVGQAASRVKNKATEAVRREFDGAVAGLGAHVTGVARDVANEIAVTATQTATQTVQRVASDPAVNRALQQLGQTASGPVKRQLTPTIIAVGVAVILFAVVLVYAVRKS